jgi:hypothetical protein
MAAHFPPAAMPSPQLDREPNQARVDLALHRQARHTQTPVELTATDRQ